MKKITLTEFDGYEIRGGSVYWAGGEKAYQKIKSNAPYIVEYAKDLEERLNIAVSALEVIEHSDERARYEARKALNVIKEPRE